MTYPDDFPEWFDALPSDALARHEGGMTITTLFSDGTILGSPASDSFGDDEFGADHDPL